MNAAARTKAMRGCFARPFIFQIGGVFCHPTTRCFASFSTTATRRRGKSFAETIFRGICSNSPLRRPTFSLIARAERRTFTAFRRPRSKIARKRFATKTLSRRTSKWVLCFILFFIFLTFGQQAILYSSGEKWMGIAGCVSYLCVIMQLFFPTLWAQ